MKVFLFRYGIQVEFLLLALALFVFGCSESQQDPAPREPIDVEAATAGYESVPEYLEVPGTVQGRHRIQLSSQSNGFVERVRVEAGQAVGRGEVLIVLDSRRVRSQKESVEAMRVEAEAALDEATRLKAAAQSGRGAAESGHRLAATTRARYEKLFAVSSVSAQELDSVRAQEEAAAAELETRQAMVAAAIGRIHQAEARIAQAHAKEKEVEVALGWTVLKSPAAARVVERVVDPGSAVFPGSPLMVLETTGFLQVQAECPTSDGALLKVGLEVRVQQTDDRSSLVLGKVSQISPLSTPHKHTVRFKVDLAETWMGPSGQFVKVLIPVGDRRALLVSERAVKRVGQLVGVFVIDDSSTARFRLVKERPFDTERVELLSGIDAGERLVSPLDRRLRDTLSDGMPVEVLR